MEEKQAKRLKSCIKKYKPVLGEYQAVEYCKFKVEKKDKE